MSDGATTGGAATDADRGDASRPAAADAPRPAATDATRATEGRETASVDTRPGPTSATVATGMAVACAAVLPMAEAAAVGLGGAALVAAGAVFGSRFTAGIGTVVLLAAVALAGLASPAPGPLVASTLFALLAWDAAQYGITVGRQLGRDARTMRLELVHAAASAAVGTAGAAVAVGAFRLVDAADSGLALVALLVGVVLLVSALR